MRVFEEQDERFAGLRTKTWLFCLAAVAGTVALVAFIGFKQGLFVAKSSVYFVTNSGQSIQPGLAVNYRGFKIGTVRGLTLADSDTVRVDLTIVAKYLPYIKQDAKARHTRDGTGSRGWRPTRIRQRQPDQ